MEMSVAPSCCDGTKQGREKEERIAQLMVREYANSKEKRNVL
jgi:hypothetical protein